MTVRLTKFAIDRHWSPSFSGTRLTYPGRHYFETIVNEFHNHPLARHAPGYADFCRIMFVENDWTDARNPAVAITETNQHLLRTEYAARRDGELPVLRRFFSSNDVETLWAPWLGIVLYTGSHLRDVEGEMTDWSGKFPWQDCDWGIVNIMGLAEPKETPMTPDTMLRNHLGPAFGGSGAPINSGAYAKSVEFWSKHAMVG